MVTKKQIFDVLDELEAKKKGSSYRALKKELKRQGYKCKETKTKLKCEKTEHYK